MDSERFDELISLSIGELREKLAYEDSEATFESFLVEYGWIDEKDDYEEEDDWDPEDEDWEDEDEDEDWDYNDGENNAVEEAINPFSVLTDEESELADHIADDIKCGKYSLDAIEGLYSEELIDAVNYLI